MSGRAGLQINGLEDWQKGLLKAERGAVDRMKDRVLRTAGLRTQEYLDNLTPVRTGRLKGSMTMGAPGNVFNINVGRNSFVFTGTAVEYATYVNDGFTQEKGRFVPGFWRNGTFHYIPGYPDGMVLTGKVVAGAHMFEKAMDYMEEDMPQILEFEFRRLYRELFG
ncbi:HK97 gp10 family phage protein [Bacillota bacterium Lsc_1132]